MGLRTSEVICVVLLAVVGGLYWGPWLALTRSMATFEPEVFLPILKRMNRNMAPIMTALLPLSLVSTVPVLVLSFNGHLETFYLAVAALILFAVTLVVTMVIEVPIVTALDVETVAALPDDWRQRRDRWMAFHLLRVVPAVAGLVLLTVGVTS
jgi:uncharacterized membrane protein